MYDTFLERLYIIIKKLKIKKQLKKIIYLSRSIFQ